MYKEKLKQLSEYEWILPKDKVPGMNVNGKIIGNKKIIDDLEDNTINQLANVAKMPGILEPVIALSDAHLGYGLPMGAVAAFDAKEGMISSGLCGFDINCGVNSILTNLTYDEVKPKLKELVSLLFKNIPCGVGSKGRLKLTKDQLDQVLLNGINWAIENGYGTKEDIKQTEEKGCMPGANPKKVSDLAKKRGLQQLGTLGAGNHFLEIQKVSEIFDKKTSEKWGIQSKNQVMIMLHCGSRGFGHQVASDYLKIQEDATKKYNIKLADRQLACAPVSSKEGQDYFEAMKTAVNYSFTNRLVMTQWIRESFQEIFKKDWESMNMKTLYAIAHNVVKFEKIKGKEMYIHRKGATRSYPDLPVLIAGTMGTSSYILKGTEKALDLTFGSSVHGAGRLMSRTEAIKRFKGKEIQKELENKGESVKSNSPSSLAEEAPKAYKDVEDVIDSVHGLGISLKVAKLLPIGVIKG